MRQKMSPSSGKSLFEASPVNTLYSSIGHKLTITSSNTVCGMWFRIGRKGGARPRPLGSEAGEVDTSGAVRTNVEKLSDFHRVRLIKFSEPLEKPVMVTLRLKPRCTVLWCCCACGSGGYNDVIIPICVDVGCGHIRCRECHVRTLLYEG